MKILAWILSLWSLLFSFGVECGESFVSMEDVLEGQFRHPQQRQWVAFQQSSNSFKSKLWGVIKKGEVWGRISWKWRLGWLTSCRRSYLTFCDRLLELALMDRALVVRAQAASVLGVVYADKADGRIIRKLADAYGNDRNYRHEQPLFVQYRILFALFKIGGSGVGKGKDLASFHPDTLHYWSMLGG